MTDAEILTRIAERILSGGSFYAGVNEMCVSDARYNLLSSARDYWLCGAAWYERDCEELCLASLFLAAMAETGDL